jgi:hypothetical protein
MLMRYMVCVIALCNPFFVVCMEKERPQQSGQTPAFNHSDVRYDLYTVQFPQPLPPSHQSSSPISVPTTRKVSQSAFDEDGSPSGKYWELLMMSEHDTPPLRESSITNSIPVYSPVNYVNTATEPGWQVLHEIELAPYTSNLASPMPIYYHPQQQQQTLPQSYAPQIVLNTNTLVLANDQPRRNAYDKALLLMGLESSDTKQKNVLVRELYECVQACKDAKLYDIDEDLLGRFAYIQKEQHADKVALFFCILKRHNEVISLNKNEKNVSLFDLHPLVAALDLPKSFVEQPVVGPQSMRLLLSNLWKVRSSNVKDIVAWLYGKDTLKQDNKTSTGLEKNWRTLFMYKALLTCAHRTFEHINFLLDTIEQAKKSEFICDESELGQYALDYKISLQNVDSFTSLIQTLDSSVGFTHEYCKYMISLLCHMIKNYNEVRELQNITINPTDNDVCWYRKAKDFGISFPGRFKEFNSALEAFDNFITNVATLFGSIRLTSTANLTNVYFIDREVNQFSGLLFPQH